MTSSWTLFTQPKAAAASPRTEASGFHPDRRSDSLSSTVQVSNLHLQFAMGLFNKKKEETNSCCCVGNCTPKTMAKTEASKSGVGVKVLGSGCVKCKTLENATREALVELGMDTTIGHVTDFSQIAAYGVMTTPALVVDGKVVSYGKVLTKKEAKTIIADARR